MVLVVAEEVLMRIMRLLRAMRSKGVERVTRIWKVIGTTRTAATIGGQRRFLSQMGL